MLAEFSKFSCVDALVKNWRAAMPAYWTSHNPTLGIHCHPRSGADAAICMDPPIRNTNRTVSLAAFRPARVLSTSRPGCTVLSFPATHLKVIWVIAIECQCASLSRQESNLGIRWNHWSKPGEAKFIFTHGLPSRINPAQTEDHGTLSNASKRGSYPCR